MALGRGIARGSERGDAPACGIGRRGGCCERWVVTSNGAARVRPKGLREKRSARRVAAGGREREGGGARSARFVTQCRGRIDRHSVSRSASCRVVCAGACFVCALRGLRSA